MALTIKCPKLYVIGDRGVFRTDKDWLSALEDVGDALVPEESALQVRVKGSCDETRWKRMSKARELLEPAIARGLKVFVNGSPAQAKELAYPGVHLTEKSIPLEPAMPPTTLELAASVHSLDAVQKAYRAGVSFAVYGPVFRPKCKDAEPVGIESLRRVSRVTPIPLLALGGITPERVAACLDAGAKGVACISTVMKSTNRPQIIRRLLGKRD